MTDYRLTDKNFEDFYQAYLLSFKGEDTQKRREYFKIRYQNVKPYGYYEDGKFLAGLLRLPFQVQLDGKQYSMDGIGEVMSLPENLSVVNATTILKQALKDMYAEGVTFSYLAPFSFSYYRQCGYEYVFDNYGYQISFDKFPKIPVASNGKLVKVNLSEVDTELKELYHNLTQHDEGGVIRPDWWWDFLAASPQDWQVVEYFNADKQLTGYLIYTLVGDVMTIKELIYRDVNAFKMLMKFIKRHANSYKTLQYDSPILVNNLDLFAEPGQVKLEIKPYMMARIVNVSELFKQYFASDENIIIKVTDNVLSENDGCWTLQGEKIGSSEYDIQIDIRELSQVVFGKKTLTELSFFDKVQGSQDKLRKLEKLLTIKKPALRDYF